MKTKMFGISFLLELMTCLAFKQTNKQSGYQMVSEGGANTCNSVLTQTCERYCHPL